MRADVAALAEEYAPELPHGASGAASAAWGQLIGRVSFEVFDQYNGALTAPADFFVHAVGRLAVEAGVGPAAR